MYAIHHMRLGGHCSHHTIASHKDWNGRGPNVQRMEVVQGIICIGNQHQTKQDAAHSYASDGETPPGYSGTPRKLIWTKHDGSYRFTSCKLIAKQIRSQSKLGPPPWSTQTRWCNRSVQEPVGQPRIHVYSQGMRGKGQPSGGHGPCLGQQM